MPTYYHFSTSTNAIHITSSSEPLKMPKFKSGDIVRWVTFPNTSNGILVTKSAYNERFGKDLVVEMYDPNSDVYKTYYKGTKQGGYWIPAKCLVLISEAYLDLMAKTNYTTFVQELGCLSREAAEVAKNINLTVKVDPKLGLSIEHFNEIKAQFKVIQKLIANHPEEDELEYIKDQMKYILSILSKSVKARTKIELEKKEYMEALRAKVEDKVPF